MNLLDVQTELSSKLDTIVGLRAFPYWIDKVSPPAGIVGVPDSIDYDQTYQRGMDAITLPVFVLVGRATDRSSHAQLSVYADGSGSKSIKATLDSSTSNTYSECDTVRVVSVAFDTYVSAGVQLAGAEFTVDITGSGS